MLDNSVVCRSDSTYAERPVALYWQGRRLEISQILARWRTPNGKHFLVEVQENALYDLYYDEWQKTWQVSQS